MEPSITAVENRYQELCLDLNLDEAVKKRAWNNFKRAKSRYSLEGEQLHWLACAVYVSCRESVVPTVDSGLTEGNYVSLTRLLRSSRLNVIQFFNKITKWAEMTNMPQSLRNKTNSLERNFSVSSVIYKKFEPIFLDIFKDPEAVPTPRVPRGRKQRRIVCSSNDVLKLCWTLYLTVKANFPAISDDLVNSYHLLLCSIDLILANAVMTSRTDLLNPDFKGLPENFSSPDWKAPASTPSFIELLCELHDGINIDALRIKIHWWNPYISDLITKKVLRGNPDVLLTGLLETAHFEINMKNINKKYEEFVLTHGDFDERVFLNDEEASNDIGTPSKVIGPDTPNDLTQRVAEKRHLKDHIEERSRNLITDTPLTGRGFLKEKAGLSTPVSMATQCISRLQSLLAGSKSEPSDKLREIFSQCENDPTDDVMKRMKDIGGLFFNSYCLPFEGQPGPHIDFAKKRLDLAERLYYKTLELIMVYEQKRLQNKLNLSQLLEHDSFHCSLFASCVEIVIYCYNSQRTFPWILEALNLKPYYFCKIIEIVIKAQQDLTRDIVKHLNHIQEQILESLAWESDSPLWGILAAENKLAPSCMEVTHSYQLEDMNAASTNKTSALTCSTSVIHPRVRSLAAEPVHPSDPSASPVSAHDRFSSPVPQTARRKLFVDKAKTPPDTKMTDKTLVTLVTTRTGSNAETTVSLLNKSPTSTKTIVPIQSMLSSGKPIVYQTKIIHVATSTNNVAVGKPMPVASLAVGKPTPIHLTALNPPVPTASNHTDTKPQRCDSIGLFFRKVYLLASVRLRDLCQRLELSDELRQKTWTCFQQAIVYHTTLMKDRHMDQLMMCSLFLMCKITRQDRTFQEIMRSYRMQPQAKPDVYRCVLLTDPDISNNADENNTKRVRRKSSSQPSTSGCASAPVSPCSGEERGDINLFYNRIFVKKLQEFALTLSSNDGQTPRPLQAPELSPLPLWYSHPGSPRRVASNLSIYTSPHRPSRHKPEMNGMSHIISKSPSRNLSQINEMIREQPRRKRALQLDDVDTASEKRRRLGSIMSQRLKDVDKDRQAMHSNSSAASTNTSSDQQNAEKS